MSEKFSLSVNGSTHTVTADPDMPLLYALRDDLGLNNRILAAGWRNAAPARCIWTVGRSDHASRRSLQLAMAKSRPWPD
jgi:aerobic-type carbon monoxide dehydrogenase small subunit (CoxS/CutS family)